MKKVLLAMTVVLVLLGLGEWAAREVDWAGTKVLDRHPDWYKTDAAGFRQPATPIGAPATGQFRIVVLSGDETWGPGVQTQDLWTVKLEKEFGGRVQILNRALLGANVAGSAVVAQSAVNESPALILWAVSPAMLLESPDTLQPEHTDLPQWWRLGIVLERMLRRGRYAAAQAQNRSTRISLRGAAPGAPGIELMSGSLGIISDAAQPVGAKIAGFIIPDFGQDKDYSLLPVHDQMARVFAQWTVPVIDPLGDYREENTRKLRLDESHPVPGVEGHEFLAKKAADGLRRLGLVP